MLEVDVYHEIIDSSEYQKLKEFRQHGNYSVYDHSIDTCFTCFRISRKLHIRVDSVALTKGALLHDYYLYDWHDDNSPKHHFTKHPSLAAKNAKRDFALTAKEERIIRSHMFPVSLRIPTSREGFILTIADKYCAVREFWRSWRSN